MLLVHLNKFGWIWMDRGKSKREKDKLKRINTKYDLIQNKKIDIN